MAIRTQNKVVVPEEAVATPAQESPVETPVTETAVATKQQVAPPAVTPDQGAIPSIMELRDKWPAEEVGNIFKRSRITGKAGALYCDKILFGEFIDIQVHSHSGRFMVVPVSDTQNDPKVAPACRPSYDGKNVYDRESGQLMPISEYADSIKDTFPKGVKVSKYYDIFGNVFNSDKNKEAAKAAGICQVSISPTAVDDFNAYARQAKYREREGVILASHRNCLRISADPHVGDKTYVIMKFTPSPLDVLENYTPILE